MPDPLPEEEEIHVQDLKNDLKEVTKCYAKEAESRRKKRKNPYQNLTTGQSSGLDRLKKREDVVVFQTDKSGRFAVDSKDSYVEATMPHVIGDGIVEEAVHERAQKETRRAGG